MKRFFVFLLVISTVALACDPTDDYDKLVQKVELRPEFEMNPPIAARIAIEVLEEEQGDKNLRYIAEFDREKIQDEYLAIMLSDEKVVLRDDGKGADEKEGDGLYSIFLKEDVKAIAGELSERARISLDKENLINFRNRSIQTASIADIRQFDGKEFDRGQIFEIPRDLIGRIRRISSFEKTLMITNLGVIEDGDRTFNPCTTAGTANGVWTFGHLMRQLATPSPGTTLTDLAVSDFVRNWLGNWINNQNVNGENLPKRDDIADLILDWETKSGVGPNGILKMEFAPFKLIAIVNRLDLRGNSGYGFSNAGEGRFVFNALDSSCGPMPFTVIFEYGINKKTCTSVKAFAQEWDDLSSMSLGSTAYNTALQNITDQFTLSGTDPSKPNESSLNQVRTNERGIGSPWELREFNLLPSGQLGIVDVKQEPAVKYNGDNPTATSPDADVAEMVQWVNSHSAAIVSNHYTVPLVNPATGKAFRGGHSLFVGDNAGTIWNDRGIATGTISSDEARHVFSLNTCSACHGGETETIFTHINPSAFGTEATLSGFLTGVTVSDPANRPAGSPTIRHFNDLLRRENDLAALLSSFCLELPFFELSHHLLFEPVWMSH